MEGAHGGGGGGPAPFLLKTYEMIDDPSTNEVVSWGEAGTSFVVWDPPDFAARLLPTYFKHNNFSSFIRQLNTYGFRKIDSERWEFANDHFIKGKQHLLKSIHRRKPIHSHSQPPPGPLPEAERAALVEEIDRLTRERTALQNELWRFQQQQSGTEMQIGDIERRIQDMEQRQLKMITFLQKATTNSRFMENLIKMANGFPGPTTMSVSSPGLPVLPDAPLTDSFQKKRRFPPGEEMQYSPELVENCNHNNSYTNNNNSSLYEDPCSSSSSGRTDFNSINQNLDKLQLGLCPAMAAMSTHSSNEEDDTGPHVRIPDTGTSLFPLKSTPLAGDGPFSSHLDLTLSSFPSMEVTMCPNSNTANVSCGNERPELVVCNGTGIRTENKSASENGIGNGKENEKLVGSLNGSGGSQNEATDKDEVAGQPANDVFWEQFLTERPGCDSEEASSGLRSNPIPSPSGQSRAGKEMENLKL